MLMIIRDFSPPSVPVLALLLACLVPALAAAQESSAPPGLLSVAPPIRLDFLREPAPLDMTIPPNFRPGRFRLFQIQPGFPSVPVGLEDDLTPPEPEALSVAGGTSGGTDDSPLQAWLGLGNPYFDFRRPGDINTVGFYRLHAQYQLLDTPTTGLSFGLEGVTPAGLEDNGVEHGSTACGPALGWFQELGGGTAVQGFLGQQLRLNSRWKGNLDRGLRTGLAVQQPLVESPDGQALFIFVEALSRYRYTDNPGQRPLACELVPGVHWRLSDDWWLSSGVIVPFHGQGGRPGLWQITCSWRF